MRTLIVLLTLSLSGLSAMAGGAPKVVVSIQPLHAIVASVMGDIGEPTLLLKGQLGEHRATFTPHQIAEIASADAVFLVSRGLEAKLAQMSGSEAVEGRAFRFLADAPGVLRLAVREGGVWADHHHDEEEEGGEHADGLLAYDPHVWLDPENAKAMAHAIASDLSAVDGSNAAIYAANAERFAASLDTLSVDINKTLTPLREKRFVVFHDAFQYFERRFALSGAGAIADVSAAPPSPRRLSEIKQLIAGNGVTCVFREPQYDDRYVRAAIEDGGARPGVLDPIGAGLEPGPNAYARLLANLARDFAACMN